MSAWARRMGTERYIDVMRNVFTILEPERTVIFINDENRAETISAYRAAGGHSPETIVGVPHREGKANNMPQDQTHFQESGSILSNSTFVFDPNGTVRFAFVNGNDHHVFTVREPGKDIRLPNSLTLELLYIKMMADPIISMMRLISNSNE